MVLTPVQLVKPRAELHFAATSPDGNPADPQRRSAWDRTFRPSPRPAITPSAPQQNSAFPQKPYLRHSMPSVSDTFQYSGTQGSTEITSLIDGGQIFGKVNDVLSLAKSSVYVDLYNFQSTALYPEKSSPLGQPGADIQGALAERMVAMKKANPALDIKVIIDNHKDPEFGENYNDRTIDYLRKGGIDVVTYPNFSTISHVKALIVDGKYAVLGGMNWGNHSATNHDAAVFIEGPDVRNIFNTLIKQDWVSSGRDANELPKMNNFKAGKIKILQTASKESEGGAKDEIFRELLTQIANAKESIYAELFNITQPYVMESLLVAHKRMTAAGKEGVKILIDPGLFFAFPAVRKSAQMLAKAGLPIRFYETNRDIEEKLHAKWSVFDRKKVLIGSANWSGAGLLSNGEDLAEEGKLKQRVSRSNHEVALLFESPKLARNYAAQALWDWKNASMPVMELNANNRWVPIPTPAKLTDPASLKLTEAPPKPPKKVKETEEADDDGSTLAFA